MSRDSIYSHGAWREVLDLNFPLLSDWNGDAVRACDIACDIQGMRDAPVRSAFLIGRDGMIRQAWRYEPREVPDVEELLRAARSLA